MLVCEYTEAHDKCAGRFLLLTTKSQGIYGTVHACIECIDPFYLCFKCYRRKDDFHSHHDKWELRGTEYENANEEKSVKDAASSESSTALVKQVQDDDDEGDWSNDDDTKVEET